MAEKGQLATSVREAGMGGVGIAGGCELSASKGRKARKLPKLRGKATKACSLSFFAIRHLAVNHNRTTQNSANRLRTNF